MNDLDMAVRIEVGATEQQRASIMGAVKSLGWTDLAIDDRAVFEPRGGLFEIATIFEISAGLTIAETVKGFFGKAGGDAWDGLRSFVRRLRRDSTDRPIEVNVADSGLAVTLLIDTRYSDRALTELSEATVTDLQRCSVYYDSEARRWEISPHLIFEGDLER